MIYFGRKSKTFRIIRSSVDENVCNEGDVEWLHPQDYPTPSKQFLFCRKTFSNNLNQKYDSIYIQYRQNPMPV